MVEMNHFLVDYLSKKFTYDSLQSVKKRNEIGLDGITVHGSLVNKTIGKVI